MPIHGWQKHARLDATSIDYDGIDMTGVVTINVDASRDRIEGVVFTAIVDLVGEG